MSPPPAVIRAASIVSTPPNLALVFILLLSSFLDGTRVAVDMRKSENPASYTIRLAAAARRQSTGS